MKRIILLSIGLISITPLFAQTNPYKFQVENVKDTVVYLANYYGDKLYYSDTAYTDVNGNFSFKAIPENNQGKYAVVIPGPKYFDIIIADNEEINIKTDTTDLINNITVLKSQNNKVMYEYMHFLTERRGEREKLVSSLEENEGNEEAQKAIKDEYSVLNDQVIAYQKKTASDNQPLFVAKEIMMSVDPEVPKELQADQSSGYFYFKDHYFDNINLKDDRIVRTSIFHNKLDNYLNKTLIQNPDSIVASVDKLISKLDRGSEVFKYVVHYTTYNFETSKIMGMDKVFVHMVDTYYKDDIAFWMDTDKIKKIQEKADEKRNTLIGMAAPELILMDTSGTWISTYKDVNTKYTLLFFYDPDCGHCKKETPKLVEFYKTHSPKNITVFAVSSNHDEKWKKFIQKNEMAFYNVSIPAQAYSDAEYATRLITSGTTTYKSLKYQETFDVVTTPKILLLDENHVIVAKDIGVEQVEGFITRFEESLSAQ
ncbi:DUF5106 domain-containing protein [Cryomorpha ignava]|uniref:DUF5106 domain-containing protein n=1 Tax=Cryomorpha ignava TaxID=101383 RepID=A0A7K3WRQ5_9FLAO|nr:thioredoxin-like domain-containing protein [Cryomorpha ignava]NEN24164.1 DUF5106 domain-containing protein [Cryomorpha ignava]